MGKYINEYLNAIENCISQISDIGDLITDSSARAA